MRPDLLILDEPTTGLDRSGWFGLMELAARLNEEGMTVIFSSHNKHVVEMYARRVIRLEEGEVSEDEIRV
jgi:ABC-type multidrug transport system ATPase subunit